MSFCCGYDTGLAGVELTAVEIQETRLNLEPVSHLPNFPVNSVEFKQSITRFANRDWRSIAAAIEQAHRTESSDARLSASAAIATFTRALGRFDAAHEVDDLAALGRVLAAFQRINDLA